MVSDPLLAPCGDVRLLAPMFRVRVNGTEIERGDAEVNIKVDAFPTLIRVCRCARLVVETFVTKRDEVVGIFGRI